MAKRGRPKKTEDGKGGTRGVRVYGDVAEMLGWILEIESDWTSAGFLDPLIRPQIVMHYTRLAPAIEQLRKAKAAVQKHRQKPGSESR